MIFHSDQPIIAVEVEGRGHHQTFREEANDFEKYNAMAAMGIRLFRFQASAVLKDMDAVVDEINQLVCGVIPERSCQVR